MSNAIGNQIFYPNVTSIPGQSGGAIEKAQRKPDGAPSEFDQAFDDAISKSNDLPAAGGKGLGSSDLGQIKAPLKFSAHATQRLHDRKIALDQNTMIKVNDAIDKAEAKGIDDTLVLTKDAALIVNVRNRTVITAMDRNQMTGNVFTNIDGAVIV